MTGAHSQHRKGIVLVVADGSSALDLGASLSDALRVMSSGQVPDAEPVLG